MIFETKFGVRAWGDTCSFALLWVVVAMVCPPVKRKELCAQQDATVYLVCSYCVTLKRSQSFVVAITGLHLLLAKLRFLCMWWVAFLLACLCFRHGGSKPWETKEDRPEQNRTGLDQTKSSQTKPNQPVPYHTPFTIP